MPDISMCVDHACPMADVCKRSALSGTVATPHGQGYFDTGRAPANQWCHFIMPTSDRDFRVRRAALKAAAEAALIAAKSEQEDSINA